MGYSPSLFGQSGWILAKFFFFACLWTETKSRSINTQKEKKQGQYPAILTEQAWSIQDLLYEIKHQKKI